MNRTLLTFTGLLCIVCPALGSTAVHGDGASTIGWSKAAGAVEVAGKQGNYLRVQAIDGNVLRIWLKEGPYFHRAPSNALLDTSPLFAPLLVRSDSVSMALKSAGIALRIDRRTLGFSATTASGASPILVGGSVTWNANGGWSLKYHINPDEHLFGMGQDNQNGGSLDRRGTVRDMWTGQQINSGNVTANYPVPLVLSTGHDGHAYGIFVDDIQRLHFDLGSTDRNTLRCDAGGGEADFYVICGPTLKDVVERYTKLTGRPPLPPLWVLGYWQSKCVFWNWDDIDKSSSRLTAEGFPHDVMVIDYSWPEVLNDYVWDRRWFGKNYTPADKIAAYSRQGIKIVMSNSGPMVVKDSPTFPSGWKAGVFATDGHGNPVEGGYYHGELLDFTSPAMEGWLLPQVSPLIKSGVAGWWLDLSEPEGENPQTVYQGGTSAEIHNQYSLLETRWFEEAQLNVSPQVRPWVLTRCASAGIQRYHMSVWTGDTHSDYATLAAHPAAMLNSGLSGLAWWTCDSGGFLSGFYKNDQFGAHARLYERWMQFSAFSPITRAHHAGPVLPYEFGPDAEAGCRHYIQLRYRLLPYLYSYAWETSQTGLPITRPLALEYPQDPGSVNAPGDEYLFGRELLVAPVLAEDVTTRSVYFPPGKWFDWDGGYEYDGGRSWVVSAPQHRIPVAVRAGSIIPMAPDMENTDKGSFDPITLEVYPSGNSTFTMYRDDGRSFAYRKGEYTVTRFGCAEAVGSVNLTVAESNGLYAPHQYIVQFHLQQAPVDVWVDGAAAKATGSAAALLPMQWAWDPETRVLTVRFAARTVLNHTIVAHLSLKQLPRRVAPLLTLDLAASSKM